MDLKLKKLIINTVSLLVMGAVIFFVSNEVLFYSLLAVIFLFVVLVNYRAFIKMVKQIMEKNK